MVANRRQYLRSLGLIGSGTLLAGCIGSDDDEDPDDLVDGNGNGNGSGNGNGNGDGASADQTFYVNIHDDPVNIDWNGYNPTSGMDIHVNHIVEQPLAVPVAENDEYIPMLAEDWEFDREGGTISLREDSTWWPSGEPITAHDYVVQFHLGQHVTPPADPTFTDAKADGDYTIELTAAEPTNPGLLETTLNQTMSTPEHIFREWLEDFEEADGDEDAVDELRGEITGHRIENEDAYGSGPWKLVDWYENGMVFEPHEGHFAGDQLDFNLEFIRTETDEQMNQEVIAGNLDGTWAITPPEESIREQYPDGIEFVEMPYYAGRGLVVNHEQEPFGDPRVHLAITHALEQDVFTAEEMDEPVGPTHYSHLSSVYIDSFISEEDQEQLVDYSPQDYDAASALLEEAGFSQDDGEWYTPDDELFEFGIVSPQERVDHGRLAAEQLRGFGIGAEVEALESAVAFGNMTSGDYSVGVWDWGGGFATHGLTDHEMLWDGWWNYDVMRIPDEVEVPPFGDPDGEREAVSPIDFINEGKQAESDEEMREAVTELAWVYNQTLPSIPLTEVFDRVIFNTADWEVPDLDDPINNYRPPHIVNSWTGELQPRS